MISIKNNRQLLNKGVFILQRYSLLLKRGAAVLVLLAMVCSLFVAGTRIKTEQEYKTVNIMVNEADVRALANGNNLSNEEMLMMLKEQGVSQLLFKESSLGSLEMAGDVLIVKGAAIDTVTMRDQLPAELPRHPGNYYVIVLNNAWKEQVLKEVTAKVAGAKAYDGTIGVVTIPSSVDANGLEQSAARQSIEKIGVGFDKAWAQQVANSNMAIVAQVSSWKKPTDDALRLLAEDIKSLPNLALLMFNDKELPGYPKKIEDFYQLLIDEKGKPIAPIGQIEFSNQKGFNSLALLMNKDVVRLHTISNQEMSKFEGETQAQLASGMVEAIDRWDLAARERNMRALLVRFFDIDAPGSSLQTNLTYLSHIKDNLKQAGFTIGGDYQQMDSLQVNNFVREVIGIGICAGIMLLLLELGLPLLAAVGFVGSALCWLVLYQFAPTSAQQIMALLSVMVFPIYSCLHFLPKRALSLPQALAKLLQLCAVSAIGALLMVGVLSDKLFMLKMSQFIGIKLAHVVPILVVPFVLYIVRDKKPLTLCRALINKALDYKWAILFAILAVALFIYVARTGNSSAKLSDGEQGMRQFLTDYLGVRPRSKEFLIGYPLSVLYLMYAPRHKSLWVLTIPLVIGQVSLVNTYAHIHTPLLISLQRSFNGLLLGIIVAVILVAVVALAKKFVRWCVMKLETIESTR